MTVPIIFLEEYCMKSVILLLLSLLLFGCSVNYDNPEQAIDPSEFPLSPSDPRAKLSIDFGKYKDFSFPPDFDDEQRSVTESNDILIYDLKRNQESVLKSDQIENPTIDRSNAYQGKYASIFSDPNKAIIGTDDRQKVGDPTEFYYSRFVVKLYLKFPFIDASATGVMIGPKTVLTAGHCVYWFNTLENGKGYWANSIRVIPALNDGYTPYGDAWGTVFCTSREWTDNRNPKQDWGIIELDRNIGYHTGWAGMAVVSDPSKMVGKVVRSFGYPGDKDFGMGMYTDYDLVIGMDDALIDFNIDVLHGQSGSPIYLESDLGVTRAIYSRNTGGHNYAPYLNQNLFNTIHQFKNEHVQDPVLW